MTTIDELERALLSAQTGEPEDSVESAVMVYLSAQAVIEAYEAVKERAKMVIGDVMVETGHTRYSTRAGTAAVTSPSNVVSYDGRALDALCRSDADLALKLFPHRRESQRAGTLRITAARGGA